MTNAVIMEREKKKASPVKAPKKKKSNGFVIGLTIAGVCIGGTAGVLAYKKWSNANDLVVASATAGYEAGMEAYESAKNQAASEVYQEYYDNSYYYAEKKNHVSNNVLITIDSVEEINRLEVLEVSANTVVTEESSNSFAWFSFTGSAVYYVDLNTADYIIDQQRSTVVVRLSKPVLDYRGLNEVENLMSKTKSILSNGSIANGEKIADSLIKKGDEQIQKELQEEQDNPQKAKEAAISFITSLVMQTNPDVPDIHVVVEFME